MSARLNACVDCCCLMSIGREFQSLGAAKVKARSPKDLVRTRGTVKVNWSREERRLREGSVDRKQF